MNCRVPTGGWTRTRTTRRTFPTTFCCVIGVFASRARPRRAWAVAGSSCAAPPTSPCGLVTVAVIWYCMFRRATRPESARIWTFEISDWLRRVPVGVLRLSSLQPATSNPSTRAAGPIRRSDVPLMPDLPVVTAARVPAVPSALLSSGSAAGDAHRGDAARAGTPWIRRPSCPFTPGHATAVAAPGPAPGRRGGAVRHDPGAPARCPRAEVDRPGESTRDQERLSMARHPGVYRLVEILSGGSEPRWVRPAILTGLGQSRDAATGRPKRRRRGPGARWLPYSEGWNSSSPRWRRSAIWYVCRSARDVGLCAAAKRARATSARRAAAGRAALSAAYWRNAPSSAW